MRLLFFVVACLVFTFSLGGQSIYGITETNELYRIDVNGGGCDETFVVNVNTVGLPDITFHPNGNLYGVSLGGSIVQIDTLTGNIALIHNLPPDFNDDFLFYNSLTASTEGLLYITGDHGELYTYDVVNAQEEYLGNIEFMAAGDLTFYEGELYVSTSDRKIVKIDVMNPENSSIEINNATDFFLFGLSSVTVDCGDQSTYAISNIFFGGDSKLYRVFWAPGILSLVCNLENSYFGSASTSEFVTPSEPIVVESIIPQPTTCGLDNGMLTVTASGGAGLLSYSLEGGLFQQSGAFTNLSPGSYTIVVMDDAGCVASGEAVILSSTLPTITELVTGNTTCAENNGTLIAAASGGTGTLAYSLDGINYQTSSSFAGLVPDEYTLSVIDEADCEVLAEVVIAESTALVLEAIEVISADCGEDNGGIILGLEADPVDLQILIDEENYLSAQSINDLGTGDFLLEIIDQYGCRIDTLITIPQNQCPIYIPNAFSPNRDGVNDNFRIYPHPRFRGTFLRFDIYDRWGALHYSLRNFSAEELKWAGTFNGKKAAGGVYTYYLEFVSEEGRKQVRAGDIMLTR